MKNITHKEYLENILYTRKLELEEAEIKHRVFKAEIEKEKELLRKQINSIEAHLANCVE